MPTERAGAGTVVEAVNVVEEFVLGLTDSPWVLVAVAVLATIDGFFPPVPSESIIIAVAVLTTAGQGPSLWFLALAGAVGAFAGDLIAYTIGTKVPIDRLRIFASPRGQRSLAWARRALARRGTVFILSARFVPIGRVAVNMTAGAVGFPRRRFVVIAACAALIWGAYSTLLGMSAGVFLHDHPLIAVLAGVAGGIVLGLALDRVLALVQRRWFPSLPTMDVDLPGAPAPRSAEPGTAADAEQPGP
ncbi:MAG: DedA family protein [Georgenia sp.]